MLRTLSSPNPKKIEGVSRPHPIAAAWERDCDAWRLRLDSAPGGPLGRRTGRICAEFLVGAV